MRNVSQINPGRYPPYYRSREIMELAEWVRAGVSGSIVGLAGSGKSNLMFVLGREPERLRQYLGTNAPTVAVITVDLNNLADDRVATLYRLIIRAMFEARGQFDTALQALIASQYEAHKLSIDPFITQNAVRDLLQQSRERDMRLIFLFDQFDTFCNLATPAMTNSLRGLRDAFKEHLCYIVGMRQSLASFANPNMLGELYELLDLHTLWLGPMSEENCIQMILMETHTAEKPPTDKEKEKLIQLSGGFPSLIKAACQWWLSLTTPVPVPGWEEVLINLSAIRYRLREIWYGLDNEEQSCLIDLVQGRFTLEQMQHSSWNQLLQKGVCVFVDGQWRVAGDLLKRFVETAVSPYDGQLWFDDITGNIYKGEGIIRELAPLEQSVLQFLLENPLQRHTKTDIIVHAWPKELRKLGVTDDSLYQVIAALRRKIEQNPSKPTYLVTWRGRPEGGYQLYPNGSPPQPGK